VGGDQPDLIESGLELIRAGRHFEAHEELEAEWRSAAPEERDFVQGLVHVAVAWYQAGRGNRNGCARQLEKAARRLAPYAPAHRGVDVADLLVRVAAARARVESGVLELGPALPARGGTSSAPW
jgi:predicted metal-dependent hydrolase